MKTMTRTGRTSRPRSTPGLQALGHGGGHEVLLRFALTMPASSGVHGLRDTSGRALSVSRPHDPQERAADRAADAVMADSPGAGHSFDRGGVLPEGTMARSGSPFPGVESGVPRGYGLSREGEPLSAGTRAFYEQRFGYDFSAVRVHSDADAGRQALGYQSRAFTLGRDIAFAPREYQPSTPAGRHLLAHELAHVVQQDRPGAVSAPAVHRKLVATGDAAGFAALANSIIAVQFEVVVGTGGEITLKTTSAQGPLTPEAQALVDTLRKVINDSGDTSIEFIHGQTSTRASDARVLLGSFPQGKVDLDDLAALGFQESIGLGQGTTGGAILAHEIEEQFRKQQAGEAFGTAHAAALGVEATAVGATRTESRKTIPGGFEFTFTSTYPDGRIVDVKFDVKNGNISNVRRTVRP